MVTNCYRFESVEKMGLAKDTQTFWEKWARITRIPLTQPRYIRFRELMEERAGLYYDDETHLKDLDVDVKCFFELLEALPYLTSPKKANKPGKRYQRLRVKSIEKHLNLVAFIIEQQLTVDNLWRRDFTRRKRIRWERVCETWQQAYPDDPITPAVLKATFYRYAANPDIQKEYFNRKYREYANEFAELFSKLITENKEALERFGRAIERFGQLAITMFEGVGQFALNHKDDIENLFLLACKLNSMTDSEQEEYFKLLEAEFENKKGSVDGVNY